MKKSELKELIRHIVTEVKKAKKARLAEGIAEGPPGGHPAGTPPEGQYHDYDGLDGFGSLSDFGDDETDPLALLGLEESSGNSNVKDLGASTMKKSPEKKDNTQMGYEDKTITSTTSPKEKKEGKKLPVVSKKSNTEKDHFASKKNTDTLPAKEKKESPALPVGGHGAKGIKEDIMKMIRESLEEMARTAAVKGSDGIVRGGVGVNNRKQDPKSPTGWSIIGHKKFPDGTPVEAPKDTGVNYVKKGTNPNMGRPSATDVVANDSPVITTPAATTRTEEAIEDFVKYNPDAKFQDVVDMLNDSNTEETPFNLSPTLIKKTIDDIKKFAADIDANNIKGPSSKNLKNIKQADFIPDEFGDDEF